jgi:S1-C subfamily serine protease
MEADVLTQLSERIAALTASAARHVVRVEGRRHAPSSGVVWSADGVVVTAHHTLERDEDVEVGLPSGERAPAEFVGRDPTTDLALLRVQAPGLEPAPWSEETRVAAGQLALGVARPGRGPRAALALVTRVAGEYRSQGGGRIDAYVETSLPREPGVSGSLVVAADGRAFGVATTGLVRRAVMALPAATLRRVVKALLAHGEIPRGYLGLATTPVPLPPALRQRTGEHVALLVSRVDPESPAERAGILLGDALLSFGAETLQDPGELLTLLAEDRIGDTVAMKLLRAGEVKDVQVTIGVRGRRS